MTDVGEVQKVPTELKVAIQKGRAAKGLTQKQLATQLNMQPQVIQGYENGKEVPNNAVIAKIEKALGCKLPRMPKKKPGAEYSSACCGSPYSSAGECVRPPVWAAGALDSVCESARSRGT